MSLKIGTCLKQEWHKDKNPYNWLKLLKDCGFDSVDFSLDEFIDVASLSKTKEYSSFFDKDINEITEYFRPLKDACLKTGMVIGQVHAPFPLLFKDNEKFNEYTLSVLEKSLAICDYLDCAAIVVHVSPANGRKEEYEINFNYYKKTIPLVKKYPKVKICIENLFGRLLDRKSDGRLSIASDLCKFVDELNLLAGGDYYGVCFDVGHANLTGKNVKDYIEELGDRLKVLHIHDNDAKEDLHMIPYSYLASKTAHVCDWQGFIDGLKNIGYKGIINFETLRVYEVYPEAVLDEVLRLISAIGRFWASSIDSK